MLFIRETASGQHWDSVEIPILHLSGEERLVLWNSANIKDAEGIIIATIAQGQDISQRKLMGEIAFYRKRAFANHFVIDW